MAKRKPERGGVNDSAACLTATALVVIALGIAVTMRHPACTSGQCVRTAAEQRAVQASPVVLTRDAAVQQFERAMRVVAENEGGFVPVDGSTDAPALFGINRKWHAAAFEKAKRLTETHGESAGKAYARQFYKREFWDRFGLDALPPAAQVVVLDGVVNHSHAFSKRLVRAAQKGATAGQLLVMRWNEYHRLAKAAPDAYAPSLPGWIARLETTAKAAMDS